MRTIMQFAAGAAVGALAVMVLVKSPTSATTPAPAPQSISIEQLSRSIDLGALPVQEVKDPF
jgi:hypothetical protein